MAASVEAWLRTIKHNNAEEAFYIILNISCKDVLNIFTVIRIDKQFVYSCMFVCLTETYEHPSHVRPFPLPPTPPSPVQESFHALDRATSEIALHSPSSPSFNIRASSLSLEDQGTSDYVNVKQRNEADKSLLSGPQLPSLTNRGQQKFYEYSIKSSSYAAKASPHPEPALPASVNVRNVLVMEGKRDVKGEPVERSCQFSMHQPENQGNEYVSMASYDLGATKSSWHTLIPQNDEQQDGSSSNEKPDRHEYISMARNDLRATEGSWHF